MQAANAATSVRPIRNSVATIEERTWAQLYRRIQDSAVAEEVVQILDANQDLIRTSTGLYLRAKETLQRQANRQQKFRALRQAGGLVSLRAFERLTVESAAAKLWARFYRRIDDPILAGEILGFLDDHPESKQAHAGLYVRARLTVRRQAARVQRWTGLRNLFRFAFGVSVDRDLPSNRDTAQA